MTGMIRRIRLALPLAALLLALPADAQRNTRTERGETWISVNDEGGRRTEMRARGDIQFNDAGDWVVSVAPDGYLTLSESGRGTDRRIDFRPGQGGMRVRYAVDGDDRRLDAAGRTWAEGMIGTAVRESGLGAEARVARIRARGGVAGVLADMGRLQSDAARRAYYRALLAGGAMSNAEFARVMADVGRRMGSDTETRLVLVEAVDRAEGGGRLAALLDAAVGMESDTETRLVLIRAAERHRLADAAARQAFFRAVSGIESNVERRLVLTSVLGQRPSEATVVSALQSARGMSSDVEKRLVLSQVPSSMLRTGRVTAAYRGVVDAMRSDSERRIALNRLADGGR